jgi:hypothetical protein
MYTLVVKGPRRATLAYHHLDNNVDLRDLIAVYHAMGYGDEVLIVEERREQKAA